MVSFDTGVEVQLAWWLTPIGGFGASIDMLLAEHNIAWV